MTGLWEELPSLAPAGPRVLRPGHNPCMVEAGPWVGGGREFAALFFDCFPSQVKTKSGGRTATTVAAQSAKMGR
jgi:hypothetical protein